jgi:hypothetical protein
MNTLRTHQTELVERLTSFHTPGSLALVAPPWTGGQTALAAAAATTAAQGRLVVIVTHLRMTAHQWMRRLEEAGTEPIVLIRGGSDLRLALSKGMAAWPEHGVVVATDVSLATGTISHKLGLRPDLLIVDAAESTPPEAVDSLLQLVAGARTTVARSHGSPPGWFLSTQIVEWSPENVLPDRRDRYTVHTVPYFVDSDERELIERGTAFLEAVRGPLAPEAVTRYGIQVRLGRVAASDSQDLLHGTPHAPEITLDEVKQRELNELLDAFDELEPDPRLETISGLVASARLERRPCILVVDELRAVGYALRHLMDSVGADILELTSRIRPDEVAHVLEALATGVTVVASAPFVGSGDELPDGCWNIWWSLPTTVAEAEARVGVGFNARDVHVHVPMPERRLFAAPLAVEAFLAKHSS